MLPRTSIDALVAAPSRRRRVGRTVAFLGVAALALVLLNVLGVDLESWFESLFDALTAVDPRVRRRRAPLPDPRNGALGDRVEAILRAAYPRESVEVMPVLTCYAVAVAGNDVLPANLGTLVMLVMLMAVIPGSSFPGLVGAQVVHKLFFVVAGAFVYLYLFLSVPGSFETELGLLRIIARSPSSWWRA